MDMLDPPISLLFKEDVREKLFTYFIADSAVNTDIFSYLLYAIPKLQLINT